MSHLACAGYQSSLDCVIEEYCHIVIHGNKENQPQFSRPWDATNGRFNDLMAAFSKAAPHFQLTMVLGRYQ